MRRFLVLFPTTYDALLAEKNWPQSGYPGKLRPIPRSLSSSCGLCLETDLPDPIIPTDIIARWNIEWEQIVLVDGDKLTTFKIVKKGDPAP